jgi:hypothetical protein
LDFRGLAKRLMKVKREQEYGLETPLSTLQVSVAVIDLTILVWCASGVSWAEVDTRGLSQPRFPMVDELNPLLVDARIDVPTLIHILFVETSDRNTSNLEL